MNLVSCSVVVVCSSLRSIKNLRDYKSHWNAEDWISNLYNLYISYIYMPIRFKNRMKSKSLNTDSISVLIFNQTMQ